MTPAELAIIVLTEMEDTRAAESKLGDDWAVHAAYDLGYIAAVRKIRELLTPGAELPTIAAREGGA